MGKVILEFDSVEESQEIQDAINGWRWKTVMWELDQKLRSVVKHDVSLIEPNKEASAIEVDLADKMREVIRDLLNDNNLSFD